MRVPVRIGDGPGTKMMIDTGMGVTLVPRGLHVSAAPNIGVPKKASVMFQNNNHDGLLGQEFLRAHVVTFDTPRASMSFGR